MVRTAGENAFVDGAGKGDLSLVDTGIGDVEKPRDFSIGQHE